MDSKARVRSRLVWYISALAISGAAVLIRWALNPVLGPQLPFSPMILAVMLCARVFGRGPSLLALLAGGSGIVMISGEQRPLPVALFFVSSLVAIWMISALRDASAHARQQARIA